MDDTDDLDPELEFSQWQERERARMERDRKWEAELEARKEDFARRKIGLEKRPEAEQSERESAAGGLKLGVFYSADDKFSKRDYGEVEDNTDHSRPTKFRPGKKY